MEIIYPESRRLCASTRPTPHEAIKDALKELSERNYLACFNIETYLDYLPDCGFNKATLQAGIVLHDLIAENKPATVRQIFYRAVSIGLFPSTGINNYTRCINIIKRLRRRGAVDFSTIVDNTRSTQKPSSWSGLNDFIETVQKAYRKDFWQEQRHYIEIWCEKDALSGVLYPITSQYDVRLQVLRGGASDSFIWSIAQQLKQIDKPIYIYYIGDHDPSGLDIERDAAEKLAEFSGRLLIWKRLAITSEEFKKYPSVQFKPKDKKLKPYLEKFGSHIVEADAIAPNELRERIKKTIERHINAEKWNQLIAIEEEERNSFQQAFKGLK